VQGRRGRTRYPRSARPQARAAAGDFTPGRAGTAACIFESFAAGGNPSRFKQL